MAKPQTVAALALVKIEGKHAFVDTTGTKAAPGAKIIYWELHWGDSQYNADPGKPTLLLDHEYVEDDEYQAFLLVKDSKNRQVVSPMIIIRVGTEVIPPPPTLAILTSSPLPDTSIGDPVDLTFTGSGGTAPYEWSIVSGNPPSGLNLDISGLYSGVPDTAEAASFRVRLTDSLGAFVDKDFIHTIQAVAPPLQITTTNVPGATNGVFYSVSLQGSGGTPPYTWSLFSGTLPTGLSLINNVIQGTPTVNGTFNFQIRLQDSIGTQVFRNYSIVVSAQTALQITTSSPLPNASLNNSYNFPITIIGGAPPYSLGLLSGTLPTGLSISNLSVSGTPTVIETDNFTLRAVDSLGASTTKAFSLTVVSEGPHDYFNELIALPQMWGNWSLRDQTQLNSLYSGSIQPGGRQITYDPGSDTDPRKQDAAKFILPANRVSLQGQDQLDLPWGVSSGDWIVTWDGFITDDWHFDNSNGDGPQNIVRYKHYQIRRSPGSDITDETRSEFSFAAAIPPIVARVNSRYYSVAGAPGPNVTDINPLAPQDNPFNIFANAWVRYWLRLQMGVGGFNLHSLWVADQTRDPIIIHNALQLGNFFPQHFNFECNTSSGPRVGPPLVMYFRNVVILQGIGTPVGNIPMRKPIAG